MYSNISIVEARYLLAVNISAACPLSTIYALCSSTKICGRMIKDIKREPQETSDVIIPLDQSGSYWQIHGRTEALPSREEERSIVQREEQQPRKTKAAQRRPVELLAGLQ